MLLFFAADCYDLPEWKQSRAKNSSKKAELGASATIPKKSQIATRQKPTRNVWLVKPGGAFAPPGEFRD